MSIVPASPGDLPDGLGGFALEHPAPRPSPAACAEALYGWLERALAPTSASVDIYDPELRDAELFGQVPVATGLTGQDALTKHRRALSPDGRVAVVPAPDRDALLAEVVRDTGWFSTAAYGLLLATPEGLRLIDRFYDGIYVRVVGVGLRAPAPR